MFMINNKVKYKNNLKILIILCLLISPISKGLATIENNSKINSELLKLLNNIKFIHADFTQTMINKSGDVLQEQFGIIQLKKPNLLNWQILNPDHLLIIIDGKNIWNYDIDLEQITVKKFKADNNNYKIINLLLGNVTQNLNDFKIILLTNNCNVKNVNRCFRLINNKKLLLSRSKSIEKKQEKFSENFSQFDLGFNQQQQLVLLRFYDQLEQQTIFNFYKFKPMLKKSAFKFIIPKGIDLIKEIDE